MKVYVIIDIKSNKLIDIVDDYKMYKSIVEGKVVKSKSFKQGQLSDLMKFLEEHLDGTRDINKYIEEYDLISRLKVHPKQKKKKENYKYVVVIKNNTLLDIKRCTKTNLKNMDRNSHKGRSLKEVFLIIKEETLLNDFAIIELMNMRGLNLSPSEFKSIIDTKHYAGLDDSYAGVKVYIDASFKNGVAGLGVLYIENNYIIIYEGRQIINVENSTSAEMEAAILAIKNSVEKYNLTKFDLFYDYRDIPLKLEVDPQYSERVCNYLEDYTIEFKKTKAHSKDVYNNIVDMISNDYRKAGECSEDTKNKILDLNREIFKNKTSSN